MTHAPHHEPNAPHAPKHHPPPDDAAAQAWAGGLTYFAAVMLMVSGILDICRGIMGLHRDAVFVTTPKYVFQFDTVSWGWIHLILGACAVVVAFGLLKAALWARIIGVTLAGLLILANFLSIPYYPLWSVVVMALSAFVIWGLCTVRRGF